MTNIRTIAFRLLVLAAFAVPACAAPKLDKDTCDQLKVEQAKFLETGILSEIQKGAQWGKANLSAERLREVEHFILLDEQLKFGCRQVTLTIDAMRAGEAATQIELNPNPAADPASSPDGSQDGAAPPGTAPAAVTGPPSKPSPKPRSERRTPEGKADKAAAKSKPKAADAFVPPERANGAIAAPAVTAGAP
ncbi:MAG: hypothetical protein ABL907_19750 [Hyphomicrobium sp.]